MHENREASIMPEPKFDTGRTVKAISHKTVMHVVEDSDPGIVPMNQPNKAGHQTTAEAGEGRPRAKENSPPSNLPPTQSGTSRSQGLWGVRQAARRNPKIRFTALLHHVTVPLLRGCFYALKRQAAPGVDGVRWKEYEQQLEIRLVDLHGRIHRGAYRAQPSRRVYIPKPDGRLRPLGIAALEDKIVQQAVVALLEPIYEEDFLGLSYGFRPRRGPHAALDALNVAIERMPVKWVLDADIRGFFDHVDHEWMLKFVQHRVADRRILRLIQKWLRAGVSVNGQWLETKVGTPQGAVISPLLANIYLHYVFDLWVHAWRRKVARGVVIAVRYADDLVVGFQHREDAERFQREFQERLAKFGLELNADKTRLIEFGRKAERDRKQRGEGKPETLDFLGFTHYCGKHRKGYFALWRKTSRKRLVAKLQRLKKQLRVRRHEPIAVVGQWLQRVVNGFYNYHGVPGNLDSLELFRQRLRRLWRHSLGRRGNKRMSWTRFMRRCDSYFPQPRNLHPYPYQRFDVAHPRWEPYARNAPVRICAGGGQ
jgi:RNA-directed DNA polymerase